MVARSTMTRLKQGPTCRLPATHRWVRLALPEMGKRDLQHWMSRAHSQRKHRMAHGPMTGDITPPIYLLNEGRISGGWTGHSHTEEPDYGVEYPEELRVRRQK